MCKGCPDFVTVYIEDIVYHLEFVDFHTRVASGIVCDLGPACSQAEGILIENDVPFILDELQH